MSAAAERRGRGGDERRMQITGADTTGVMTDIRRTHAHAVRKG